MAILVLFLLIFSLSRVITKHNDEIIHEEPTVASIETAQTERMNRLLEIKDVCFDMHIFLENLEQEPKLKAAKIIKNSKIAQLKKHGLNETSLIAIMLGLLIISTLVSLADVLKVKRDQKASGSTPDGDSNEKCSLAEFANMKRLRRESSFGGINSVKEHASSRVATLCRFESVGSAFARMRRESSAGNVLPGTEVPNTPPVGPARPPLKLLGEKDAIFLAAGCIMLI